MKNTVTITVYCCALVGLFSAQSCQPPQYLGDDPQNIVVGDDDREEVWDTRVGALGYDSFFTCTTFAIGPSTIMTALHCIRRHQDSDSDDPQVNIDGLMAKINNVEHNVVAQEEILVGADVAVLTIDGNLSDYFQLSDDLAEPSEAQIISHDATDEKLYTARDSLVTEVVNEDGQSITGLLLHRLDTGSNSGASGSPIIQSDKVVGVHLGYIEDSEFLGANSIDETVNYGVSTFDMRNAQLFFVEDVFRHEWINVVVRVFQGAVTFAKWCWKDPACRAGIASAVSSVAGSESRDWIMNYGIDQNADAASIQRAKDIVDGAAGECLLGNCDGRVADNRISKPDKNGNYPFPFSKHMHLGDKEYRKTGNCGMVMKYLKPHMEVRYRFNLLQRGGPAKLKYSAEVCGLYRTIMSLLSRAGDTHHTEFWDSNNQTEHSEKDVFSTGMFDLSPNEINFYYLLHFLPGVSTGLPNWDNYVIKSLQLLSTVPIVSTSQSIFWSESLEDDITNEQLPVFLAMAYVHSLFVEYFDRDPKPSELVEITVFAVNSNLNETQLRKHIAGLRIKEEYRNMFGEEIPNSLLIGLRQELLQNPNMSTTDIKRLVAEPKVKEVFIEIFDRDPTPEEMEEYVQQLLAGKSFVDIKFDLFRMWLASVMVPIYTLLLN